MHANRAGRSNRHAWMNGDTTTGRRSSRVSSLASASLRREDHRRNVQDNLSHSSGIYRSFKTHEFCHQDVPFVFGQWHLVRFQFSPCVKPVLHTVFDDELGMSGRVVLHEHVQTMGNFLHHRGLVAVRPERYFQFRAEGEPDTFYYKPVRRQSGGHGNQSSRALCVPTGLLRHSSNLQRSAQNWAQTSQILKIL